MTLAFDPEPQARCDEPPHRPGHEYLYAPAAPFGAAIAEWIARQQKRIRAMPTVGTGRSTPQGEGYEPSALEQLAHRTGMPSRSLRRYLTGETQWIELDTADRIALALDIPLWMLADDFKSRGETTHRHAIQNLQNRS